jgi:K+-transporting ATPase ATPase C chain
MKDWISELRTSAAAVICLAVLLCGLYPFAVWVLDQGLFPAKANGSLILRQGQVVGSSLIGRDFSGPAYFHPRPSAAGKGYDALSSGGTNLGPTSRELIETIRRRVAEYRAENGLAAGVLVPADAVTASASGLDPHISPANAYLQAHRVAAARGLSEDAVRRRIEACVEGRDLGFLGQPRVNVMKLNQALDGGRDDGR